MKRQLLKCASVGAALVFLGVFYGLAIVRTPESDAIKATDFQAGRIIDDAVFYNSNTMSVTDIQAVLDRYHSNCDMWGTGSAAGRVVTGTGYRMPAGSTRREYAAKMREAGNARYHDAPYVCMNKFYENPETHETLYDTNGVVKDGMKSAAQIIYEQAQENKINPQVLLVLLKKESYAWGDSWPLKWEYDTVTGYGCPDNAACNTKYYGFYNQVHMAAWQYNYYREHIYSYGYRPYATNNIYYSPVASCGTKAVYLENIATTSLYIYTPYTPNDAALANYPGESYCGSYGNRNFFMYFREMFGSVHENISKTNIREDIYYVASAKNLKKTLQPVNTNANNGTKIVSSARLSDKSDSYEVRENADKTYTLFNSATNKVIDIPNAEAYAGQTLQQWESNDTDAQKWYAYRNSDNTISLASKINASLVLNIEQDNSISIDYYTESDNQKLSLVTSKQLLPDGNYTISSALRNNYTLDVSGGSAKDGANVQTYGTNNSNAQSFKISFNADDGYYTIKNVASDKMLDVSGASINSGANVQIWSENNSCAQKWSILQNEDKSYKFINACGGKVLDIKGGNLNIGSNIQVWDENNSNAQKWTLIKAGSAVFYDGNYKIANYDQADLVWDVAGNGTANGVNLQLWKNNDSTAQSFMFKYLDNGYYSIIGEKSTRAIDVSGGNSSNGANIQIWTSNNTCAQQWEIKENKDSSKTFISACSRKVIDITNGKIVNGTNIQLYSENNSSAQKWQIIKASMQTLKDGEYEIANLGNEKYLLDVTGGKTDNETNVQIYEKNNTNSQKWNIQYDTVQKYYIFKTKLTDKYLSIIKKTTEDGANIGIKSKVDDCSQKWKIIKNNDDSFSILSSCDINKAIDLLNNKLINSNNAQLYSLNKTTAQKWKIK